MFEADAQQRDYFVNDIVQEDEKENQPESSRPNNG